MCFIGLVCVIVGCLLGISVFCVCGVVLCGVCSVCVVCVVYVRCVCFLLFVIV